VIAKLRAHSLLVSLGINLRHQAVEVEHRLQLIETFLKVLDLGSEFVGEFD
jgi:hypothetical protein